jgi:hypothetical protein
METRPARLRRFAPASAFTALVEAEQLFELRRVSEALAAYEEAAAAGCDSDLCRARRWLCAMLLGNFERAWAISDRVREERSKLGLTCDDAPLHLRWVWDGTPLRGRDVLIRCYHGLGDTIQFLRYTAPLKKIARSVAVQAQPELFGLLARINGIDRLSALAEPDPAFEVDIESTELPYAFRTRRQTIPRTIPYIRLESGTDIEALPFVKAWRPGLAVGLVWSAGSWDPSRSLPAGLLAPLRVVPGVRLVVLQRGAALSGLKEAGWEPDCVAADQLGDSLVEAAMLVRRLDLVIAVDTMMAHLAGALGVPVWTLLHFAADWRWLLDAADSPWYPGMRLFRQPAPGAWEPVIAAVARALTEAVGGGSSGGCR